MLCYVLSGRKGEALSARWEWVSFENKTITVQAGHGFVPKDTDCRTIPLSDRLVKILEPLRRDSGYLIAPDKEPTKAPYRIEVRFAFEKLAKIAGVPWCTPHTQRHSFASLLVQGGVSLFKVQQWLGHSDAATTQVYAHLAKYDADINGKG